MQTVGHGAVVDKDKILVAPRIFYKGDMVMYATRPALQLKGFVKLDLHKIKNYDTWIGYNQSGDEKDIFIDFDKAVTEAGRRAEAVCTLLPIIVCISLLSPIRRTKRMKISLSQAAPLHFGQRKR